MDDELSNVSMKQLQTSTTNLLIYINKRNDNYK